MEETVAEECEISKWKTRWAESEAERRTRLRGLPARAEDEILRVRYGMLKQKLVKYEEKEEMRRVKTKRRRRRLESLGDGESGREWRKQKLNNDDVLFTTLAEVALRDPAEACCPEEACKSGIGGAGDRGACYDDGGLLVKCLRELNDLDDLDDWDDPELAENKKRKRSKKIGKW